MELEFLSLDGTQGLEVALGPGFVGAGLWGELEQLRFFQP